jgi:hypothetical protein
MPALTQIALAGGCLAIVAGAAFIGTAALIRVSPSDPGPLDDE